MRRRVVRSAVAVAAVLAVTSCAYVPYPLGGPVRAPAGHPTAPEDPSVATGVSFYPACGNEELEYNGVHWYIDHVGSGDRDTEVRRRDGDRDRDRGRERDRRGRHAGGSGYSRGVERVVAPGPGDAVGTLTDFRDGTGYWVSDSGDLDAWLTTEVRTYNWVC